MQATVTPRVKVCCIGSQREMELAVRYGAAAVGLVSAMPSGPGVIDEAEIADIAARVPPGVTSVLLTSVQSVEGIIAQHQRCRTNAIQICDRLDMRAYPRLRERLPGIGLLQVIHVGGSDALKEAVSVAPFVDAILLDSGNQTLAIKELGGTGRTHDWAISRAIREAVHAPIFLAGGITPMNVSDAIKQVSPYALDVCTGVRTDGVLDEAKLARFFAGIRAASQPLAYS